jgi:hypothetical protein
MGKKKDLANEGNIAVPLSSTGPLALTTEPY